MLMNDPQTLRLGPHQEEVMALLLLLAMVVVLCLYLICNTSVGQKDRAGQSAMDGLIAIIIL